MLKLINLLKIFILILAKLIQMIKNLKIFLVIINTNLNFDFNKIQEKTLLIKKIIEKYLNRFVAISIFIKINYINYLSLYKKCKYSKKARGPK